MPTWEFACGDTSGSTLFTQNTTTYLALAGRMRDVTDEASDQTKVFSTYTWANLYVRVKTFSLDVNPALRSRVGGVNGNMLTTLTGTGVFQDTTNTDSLVSGNLINFVMTIAAGAGSMAITIVGSTLQDTGTNATLAVASNSVNAPTVNFGLTRFNGIGGMVGGNTAILATTESNVQYTIRRATTFTNLRVTILTNSIDAGTTVWRFRVNAANVNQLVNIAAGATGAFEDTTNSDTTVAGDEVNHQVVTSGAAGSITPRLAQLAHISTGREVVSASNDTVANSADGFFGAEADGFRTTAESDAQIAARAAFTAANLFVNVITHAATGGVDIFLRRNGANSALTVNVPDNATGFFEDTTNSVSVAVADTYNYFLDHGGGIGTILVGAFGFANGPTDTVTGGGRGYPGQMHNRRPRAGRLGQGFRVPR